MLCLFQVRETWCNLALVERGAIVTAVSVDQAWLDLGA